MADKITNDITLLFKTKLDEKSKQEVGKNLKSLLENAAIGFDEAETKRNLEPIIRMMQRLFDKAEIAFDADQLLAMPSRQALQKMAEIEVDQLQLAFDKALAKSGGIKIDFGDMDLSAMTEPLEKLTQELSEIGERVASTTKKSVREIENSLRSLSQTKNFDKTMAGIEKTLGVVDNPKHYTSAKKATAQLESARVAYAKSVTDNDPWEIQYQHLLTFVTRYEAMTKKIKPLVDTSNPEFKQLYEILSPKAGAAKISLEHFVDIARGNELTEYKNQPWARENTLKKIEQTLRSGITVKDGPEGGHNDNLDNNDSTPPWDVDDDGGKDNKSPRTKVPIAETPDVEAEERARIEAEKKAQAEKVAAEAAEQRRIEEEKIAEAAKKKIKVYRGIIPPEDEASSRREILDSVDGAEWWTNKKDVAQTYADQDVGGTILVGTITPKNPLVIDAGKHNFDEFAKMPGIIANLDKFPELISKISAGEGINDTQKYINDVARELGHDVVEFINVNDVMNPKEYVQIGTSYAVLNDSILQLVGALSQKSYDLKEEIGEYEKKPNMAVVPEYYFPPEDEQSVAAVDVTNDGLVKEATLLEKIQKLTTYIDNEYLSTGKHLSDFLDDVQRESNELDGELTEILTTLNLIDDKGNVTFDIKRNGEEGGGTTHNGALISDDFVLIERGDYESVKNSKLPDSTQSAAKDGVNVAEVLGYLPSKHTNGFFDVQGTAKGHNLFEGGVLSQDVVNATEDQLEQLVQAFIKARDYGFNIENGGNNIVYDKEKGFSFYDLEELSVDDTEFWNSKTEAEKKLYALEDLFSLFSGLNREHTNFANDANVGDFAGRIKGIIEAKGIVNPDAVDATGRNYEDIYDDVFSGNIDEEYDDIVALLQAEANAHKENEATIVTETRAQEALNDAKAEARQIDVKEDAATTVDKPVTTVESVDGVGTKDSIQTEELRQLLNSITYNVKVVQDTEPTEDNKISVDEAALESVLNRITYNVKIAHDDADKTANKITIDESVLESTLKRVFTNILNPHTEQNDLEPKNEPWALEKTLLSVKEVLDGVRANTTKAESVEIAPAKTDVGNVLATENTLVAIKAAVESINTKVVKGTKAKTSEGGGKKSGVGKKNSESYASSQYFPEKLKTQTMQLAKFRAQLMTTGKLTDDVDAQIYKLLDALAQVKSGPDFSQWSQKFQQLKTSVGITDIFDKAEGKEVAASYQQLIEFQKTRNKLELQYEKAQDGSALKQFYAEQLVQMNSVIAKQEEMLENEEYEAKLAKIREEQARKLGEVEAKAADKVAKKAAADQKKLDKRRAMTGKAGSAIGRAEGIWLEAEGLEQAKLPDDFKKQVSEYYDALGKLRLKHHEINTSEVVTDEQQNELIKQTAEVNKLTKQIGPLVAQYERLSGDNTEVLGASALGNASTLEEYEQGLKQAVMTATNGKAQIKGFDHETKTLTYTLKTGKHEFTEYTAEVRELDHQYTSTAGKTKRMETFLEATKRKMKELTSYFSGMAVFNRVGQELRRGIQYVRDIDLALTELKKVTDETEETYDRFLETAAKTAGKVGSTIQKVVSSTADWARLGYSMKEAAEFAESTQILMNVGEFTDVSQATDTLISAVQAFGYTAETSMDVVDLLNTIGNNYAISTADLAKSLTKSSASLVAAGGDLAEAAALTATANAIIQDADSVGTALKTTSLRLRGTSVKVLEEEGLDSDGAIESTSKLRSQVLATSGVDILTDTGAYKSTYQILLEIAEVWDQITDDKARAGLLELLAGKRNSSVIAALLQNPEDLKAAYEDAMNAEGSALKENERYLDSIQGKIDQFNNAMQAMWSNTLDSDVVKGFVGLGTEIIKIIDKIGLLNSALIALATYSMIKHRQGPIAFLGEISKLITGGASKIKNYVNSMMSMVAANTAVAQSTELTTVGSLKNAMAVARVDVANKNAILSSLGLAGADKTQLISRDTLTASTISAMVAEGKLSQTQASTIMGLLGISAASNEVNAARMNEMLTTAGLDKVQRGQIITQLGLSGSLKQLNADEVMNALTSAGMAKADAEAIMAKLGLTAANEGLAASFGALWTAIWPILAVMAGVAVIWGVVKLIDHLVVTTEELTEELDGLKSELQDIRSELDSVNSELETMEDRMAELLAKDSLSFVEQEELDRLQKENNELQRRLDLLEEEEKIKQNKTAETFVQTMESYGDKTYNRSGEMNWWQRFWSWDNAYAESQDEYIDELMGEYDKVLKVDRGELDRSVLVDEVDADWYSERIGAEVQALVDAANGLDYFEGDNLTDKQKEVNEWLDYVYNTQDKLAIMRGGENAKTNAINRIFDKDENAEISDSIDEYVEALKNGDKSAKEKIDSIIRGNADLVADLQASGIQINDEINEATDYFTSFASELEFATLEGKIKEVSSAAKSFESLLKGGLFKVDGIDTGLADLFNEEGKIIQTKLSQVFQDTSDQTRQDITNLLEGSYEQIKNGTVDVERLLTGFGLKTTQQVLEIQNKVLGEQNLELFPNLKDEIDGIIDKFNEFSSAVSSVVDALDTLEQARAEEAYSGSISIETLENLMKYTDDYAQLVEIDETGAIRLAADAEKILIEQRIEKIKTDAAAAVQTAQSNLEQAKYNAKAVNETGPVQQALTAATDGLAGAWAYLGSIIGDITDGNFSGMFERASAAYGNVAAGREEKRAQVNVSVEDAEKALANALNQQKIANALTSDNVKSKSSSEEASGGNATKEDAQKSKLEELMEEFQREMDYWENRIAANQAKYEQLQNEIDLLEKKGQKADTSYYEEQIKLTEERRKLLEGEDGKGGQKGAALAYLKELEDAGKEGSEEWWEVANTLNDIESELDDVTASIVDLQDAIGEIDTYKFEEFNTRLDNLVSKLGTIRDLIAPDGEENWFDEEGGWTESGVAVLGSYVQELEMYKQGLEETQNTISEFNKIGNGAEWSELTKEQRDAYANQFGIHSEQEYYDRQEELISQQYDFAKSISDTEQSIVDMYESNIDAVEEYIGTLIDGYNDYIDSVKEALDAERDLYEFKKNVQKQSKDIAELERKIASLSGSTNKSEIAERRKLEAQLYESRESLNDTYYDHAKNTQNEALDAEQSAYEETMNKFVEGMRESLKVATRDMDKFLGNVTTMVSLNAGAILEQYKRTELPLDDALTNPWEAAKKAVGDYSGDALVLMNTWAQNGFLTDFPNTVQTSLESPWKAGQTAVDAFKTSVDTQMKNVVSAIETNVNIASGKLSALYKQIEDTAEKAAEVSGGPPTHTHNYVDGKCSCGAVDPNYKSKEGDEEKSKKYHTTATLVIGKDILTATRSGTTGTQSGMLAKEAIMDEYRKNREKNGVSEAVYENAWLKIYRDKVNYKTEYYAKGTTGTSHDQWAITDEPQFGDELVLVPGKDGNLSFMRKGTGVVPADMTQKLFELAQIPTSDLMNKNLTAIVPNITKNDFKNEFNFESLVHVDTVDSDTLPKLEKMVDKKIDDFSRALNYSLKKFAR